ncbi:MAG: metal-dependent transcriptional regulator [Sphingobacteriales bacterium]|nr:MAG: metal-dependent transcriptional regulator [Sphingobacteriales bacterium]
MLTYTEENYLKAIYSIQHSSESGEVSVNEIAERMSTKPATVTDMLRKLSEKQLIHYEKYKKVQLSESGSREALSVLRKHRLWETFLHNKLMFTWDEVHEVAEQLEHIQSTKLVERLDEFLGFPDFDPHGDPIPKSNGDLPVSTARLLSDVAPGTMIKIVGVKDTSTAFLQQLERYNLQIGSKLLLTERMAYDNSVVLKDDQENSFQLSDKIAYNLLVV